MSTELRNQINALAVQFASQLMSALQTASLSELANEAATHGARQRGGRAGKPSAAGPVSAPSAGGGKRRRRSAADIGETVEAIVKLLKTNRAGLRAEQIREKLGLARKEIPRPIAAALASRKITKKGHKRATTYFAK